MSKIYRDPYPNIVVVIHRSEIIPIWQLSSPVKVAQKIEQLPSSV
jgi:hypothetical protein